MFFILGISISVFLLFLLLIKKDKSPADRILLIWLVLLFVHQLLHYLQYSGELYKLPYYPHLLGISLWMPVAHGVLLYFYVLEITGGQLKSKWSVLLHFLPTLSLVILAIPFYGLPAADKIRVFQNDAEGYEWYQVYSAILMFVSGLSYSIWSLLLIRKHRINIHQNFSNTDKKELQWL